jgi:hypothetical protein
MFPDIGFQAQSDLVVAERHVAAGAAVVINIRHCPVCAGMGGTIPAPGPAYAPGM